MSTQKTDFLAAFARIYNQINTVLADLDPDTVIHPDSGWRVHDLLGHLAVWYDQRVKALSAYQRGEEHRLPDFDMSDFNHRQVDERKNHPFTDIQAEWHQANRDLIALLEAIPAENYQDELMFPWGARGPMSLLLERLVEHGDEHYRELAQAVS